MGGPTEGLTADGRFVTAGNSEDDLTDQIICGLDQNGDIIHCAEIQPMEFIEEHWSEALDFDETLFANYGKDWWLGVLYKPARAGLLGRTARSNMTEAGDSVYAAFQALKRHKVQTYLLMRSMFRIGMGVDEHEAEIEQCLSSDPEQLARFQELNTVIDHQMQSAAGSFAKRIAGGGFVGFSLRRIRVPRKYLNGRPASVRYSTVGAEFLAKMTLNFALAGWGGMIRTYMNLTGLRETRTQFATSWQQGRPPSPLEYLSSAIFGDRRALSLTSDEVRDLQEIVQSCEALPPDLEAEIEAFSYMIDMFLTFYEERQ